MSRFPVPILIITYKRYNTTIQVFDIVSKLKPEFLYVSANAPHPKKPEEIEKCRKVREIFSSLSWECNLKTLFRDTHLSAKQSITGAIDWFFEDVEEGIILEDDCLVDSSFFYFCMNLLEKYRDNHKIMHISASNFLQDYSISTSYYYSVYSHIWGWATWASAWRKNSKNISRVSKKDLKEIIFNYFKREIDISYWLAIFDYVKSGNIDTWDYQWLFTIWLNNGAAITPAKNMVINLGFGSEATNTKTNKCEWKNQKSDSIYELIHPEKLVFDNIADTLTSDVLYKIKKSSQFFHFKIRIATFIPIKIKNWIKRVFFN